MEIRKKYTPSFKFNVALEAIKTENLARIARNYGINANLIARWKKQFMDNGYQVFETTPDKELDNLKKEKANLEQLVGKKETELNLLKNFSEFYQSLGGN